MTAMASNWEESVHPPNHEKKDDPQVWAISFSHPPANSIKELKHLIAKALITCK